DRIITAPRSPHSPSHPGGSDVRRAMQAAWVGVLVAACGTGASPADGGEREDAAPPIADAGVDARVDAGVDAGADGAAEHDASSGPRVFVHLRATHEPLTHDSASSGQTPRAWTSGIRSLRLLRTEDDPDPML